MAHINNPSSRETSTRELWTHNQTSSQPFLSATSSGSFSPHQVSYPLSSLAWTLHSGQGVNVYLFRDPISFSVQKFSNGIPCFLYIYSEFPKDHSLLFWFPSKEIEFLIVSDQMMNLSCKRSSPRRKPHCQPVFGVYRTHSCPASSRLHPPPHTHTKLY